MREKKIRVSGWLCPFILLITFLFLSGCSGEKNLRIKINSVPKGAYVLYRAVGDGIPCQGEWIYLGNTPIQAVRLFDEGKIEGADKIMLKIMHPGYVEQVKEWDGVSFWKEVEERDVIFWTPELVPATTK